MPVIAALILSAFATILFVVWLLLLFQAQEEDWVQAAYNKVLSNLDEIKKLEAKDKKKEEQLLQYHGLEEKVMGLFLSGNSEKEIQKRMKENERLQDGDLRSINILVLPGYVLQRRVESIGRGSINKTVYTKFVELDGRKYAVQRTQGLIAQLLSYPILGLAVIFCVGAIQLAGGNFTSGLVVLAIGIGLVTVLTYAFYDDVADKVTKRRAAISRQFPNVVSKLALLVTSGMVMDRAWKETAYSQEGELYLEMRKTAEERDNLMEPTTAYANFIDRCSTKETTKLASAIIQNLSKGNAEIGVLLKGMAKEAWQERRHTAKRDSEAANSKLMIPTMLLFVAILIMIMVPVAMSFSSF